ncbi:hypothetical protein O7632_23640 [Solwaraspora sp. WMMD406]|uniref:hypothetical protein n=1 Tax=Solwaraspora sp. WMMD406 TaxID=3016095 RepID=UPI0024163D20|nr:hypothetical protein [Solwaraspora sp. WMMD406]MDG4767066.1 hypothetical protein [Solwaraspora sp. WMMD406]
MAIASVRSAMWNWSIDGPLAAGRIRATLAAILDRPVSTLGGALAGELFSEGVVLCDVWQGTGDFPVTVDCYAAPVEPAEIQVLAAFAHRVRRRCLMPDDTLDPGRHLLVSPDNTVRPAHVDLEPTDYGERRTNLRLCGRGEPSCRHDPRCAASRWPPDSVWPTRAVA